MTQDRAQMAERVRNFVALNRYGVLSTISASQDGFPFGSVTPYDLDVAGRPVIYISLIAEHYKNLKQDSRACLTINDPFGQTDPQAHARASLLLRVAPVQESELAVVQKSYQERFPSAEGYQIAHNFMFMRGELAKIRWIGGFGEIAWVETAKYQAAPFDPLAYHGFGILDHMNQDHADAVKDLARAFGRAEEVIQVETRMVGIDRAGFELRTRGRERDLRISFPKPLAQAEDAHAAMIALLKEARLKIGTMK